MSDGSEWVNVTEGGNGLANEPLTKRVSGGVVTNNEGAQLSFMRILFHVLMNLLLYNLLWSKKWMLRYQLCQKLLLATNVIFLEVIIRVRFPLLSKMFM